MPTLSRIILLSATLPFIVLARGRGLLLGLCLSLASLDSVHNDGNRCNDRNSSNGPSQYLNDLDLMAFRKTTLYTTDTSTLFVSPHLVDKDTGNNPENGAEEQENGMEHSVKPFLRKVEAGVDGRERDSSYRREY